MKPSVFGIEKLPQGMKLIEKSDSVILVDKVIRQSALFPFNYTLAVQLNTDPITIIEPMLKEHVKKFEWLRNKLKGKK